MGVKIWKFLYFYFLKYSFSFGISSAYRKSSNLLEKHAVFLTDLFLLSADFLNNLVDGSEKVFSSFRSISSWILQFNKVERYSLSLSFGVNTQNHYVRYFFARRKTSFGCLHDF